MLCQLDDAVPEEVDHRAGVVAAAGLTGSLEVVASGEHGEVAPLAGGLAVDGVPGVGGAWAAADRFGVDIGGEGRYAESQMRWHGITIDPSRAGRKSRPSIFSG